MLSEVRSLLDSTVLCTSKCKSKEHRKTIHAALTQRVCDEYLKSILLLTCQNFHRNSIDDRSGINLLHWAATCCKPQLLSWLLDNFELFHTDSFLNAKDFESNYTPLHRALLYGNLSCAKILVQAGASLSILDLEGLSPVDLLKKNTKQVERKFESEVSQILGFGENISYNLGHVIPTRKQQFEPIEFPTFTSCTIKQISMSDFHTIFLSHDGRTFSCGHGAGGRLGHGDENAHVTPKLVDALKEKHVICIAASNHHSLAVAIDGDAYSWGHNSHKGLGHSANQEDCELRPKLIRFSKNFKSSCTFIGCAASNNASVLWSCDLLYTFGENAGHLGHPASSTVGCLPREVSLPLMKTIHSVSICQKAMVIIANKGDVFLFHEYETTKVVNRMLDLERVQVVDDFASPKDSKIRLVLLTKENKVYQWRFGDKSPIRTVFLGAGKMVYPTQVFCTSTCMSLVSLDDNLYSGNYESFSRKSTLQSTPSSGKLKRHSGETKSAAAEPKVEAALDSTRASKRVFARQSQGLYSSRMPEFLDYSECYRVGVSRVPSVFRCNFSTRSPDGRNWLISVHQSIDHLKNPNSSTLTLSSYCSDFHRLLTETADSTGDVDLLCHQKCKTIILRAHKLVLVNRSSFFSGIISKNPKIESISVPEEIDANMMDKALELFYFGKSSLSNSDGPNNAKQKARSKNLSSTSNLQSEKSVKQLDETGCSILKALRVLGLINLHKNVATLTDKVIESLSKLRFGLNSNADLMDISLLCTDGVEVRCHKCILCARVDYFRCMFGSGWIEATTKDQKPFMINGDSSTVKVLLHYLYSDELCFKSAGQAQALNEVDKMNALCKLLVLADELLLDRLRELGELDLCRMISIKNVCELLQFAETFNASALFDSCCQFVCSNLFSLIQTSHFLQLPDRVLQRVEQMYKNDPQNFVAPPVKPFIHANATVDEIQLAHVTLQSCDADLDECVKYVHQRSIDCENQSIIGKSRKQAATGVMSALRKNKRSVAIPVVTNSEKTDSNRKDSIRDVNSSFEALNVSSTSNIDDLLATVEERPILSIADRVKSQKKTSWAVQPSSPEDPIEMVSLQDVMNYEAKMLSEQMRKSIESRPKIVEERKSPTKRTGWNIQTTPMTAAALFSTSPNTVQDFVAVVPKFATKKAQPMKHAITLQPIMKEKPKIYKLDEKILGAETFSLSSIMKDEETSLKHLRDVRNKPLKYIQLEEQALQELLVAYEAELNFDETITVERCVLGKVAEPSWQAISESPRSL